MSSRFAVRWAELCVGALPLEVGEGRGGEGRGGEGRGGEGRGGEGGRGRRGWERERGDTSVCGRGCGGRDSRISEKCLPRRSTQSSGFARARCG